MTEKGKQSRVAGEKGSTPAGRLDDRFFAKEAAGVFPERLRPEVDGDEAEDDHDQCYAGEDGVDVVDGLEDDSIAGCCSTHDVAPKIVVRLRRTCPAQPDLQLRDQLQLGEDDIVLANVLDAWAFEAAEGTVI